MNLTINGDPCTVPSSLTIAEFLDHLGKDRKRVAVEVNAEVVPARLHGERRLAEGDRVEIVTLVGGGAGPEDPPADKPLKLGRFTFRSRLITGTGKYASYELMRACMEASGCEVTTVA